MEHLDFKLFSAPVAQKVEELFQKEKDGLGSLFVANLQKDHLWDLYMATIPSELNGIFRERQHYDGNFDKNFIRGIGRLLFVGNDGNIDNIWNVETVGYFQTVADKLSSEVDKSLVDSLFLPTERVFGSLPNVDNHNEEIVWDHFYFRVPKLYEDTGTIQGSFKTSMQVLLRGLEEFDIETVDMVLDLCRENNIYRGAEHIGTLEQILRDLKDYDKIKHDKSLVNRYVALQAKKRGGGVRTRNTVIGSLLVDLAEGKNLEGAVASFEAKVAPHNYKRSTALVTPKMVENAILKLEELGLRGAVTRQPVFPRDIKLSNTLFMKTNSNGVKLDVLDSLLEETTKKSKVDLSRAKEIKFDDFVNKLKIIKNVELYFEPNKSANLMTLSKDSEPTNLLKWKNGISWTYKGGTADAIKERVKEAGGKIDAKFRFSLAWHNGDDLDFHLMTPSGKVWYPRGSRKKSGFELDIDMNGMDKTDNHNPVENIFADSPSDGVYSLLVNNYNKRNNTPETQGFTIQVEMDGNIIEYRYDKPINDNENIGILEFAIKNGDMAITKVNHQLTHNIKVGNIWGLDTGSFHECSMITMSPNLWDTNGVSPVRHALFFIDGCLPEERFRPFFNEQLRGDLSEHRKVFEVISGKSLIEPQVGQLAGFGFNTFDKENSVILRVEDNNGKKEILKLTF